MTFHVAPAALPVSNAVSNGGVGTLVDIKARSASIHLPVSTAAAAVRYA